METEDEEGKETRVAEGLEGKGPLALFGVMVSVLM